MGSRLLFPHTFVQKGEVKHRLGKGGSRNKPVSSSTFLPRASSPLAPFLSSLFRAFTCPPKGHAKGYFPEKHNAYHMAPTSVSSTMGEPSVAGCAGRINSRVFPFR